VGKLIFRCPTKHCDFDSGFQADASDLDRAEFKARIRLRCKVCKEFHEFKFAEGRVSEKH